MSCDLLAHCDIICKQKAYADMNPPPPPPTFFFLSQMLSELVIHQCIVQLLHSLESHVLESFARLITITGKDLDHPQAKVGGEEGCRGRMSEKTEKRKKEGGN